MTIEFFLSTLRGNREAKKAVLQKTMREENYVPYEEKVSDCRKMIDITCWKEIDGTRTYHLDSPARWYLFITNFIEKYSDLTFSEDPEKRLKEFNALSKAGAIDEILAFVRGSKALCREYDTFDTLLTMMLEDEETNFNSLTSYLRTTIAGFSTQVEAALQKASPEEDI